MNCIIDNAILLLARQGQNPKAIKRYIRMKYRINMDLKSLKERIKKLSPNAQLTHA